MARRRQVGRRGGDGQGWRGGGGSGYGAETGWRGGGGLGRRRVRRAGVQQRVRHCCGRPGAPVHLRLREEEEDETPECSPGRELVRVQQVEIGRLSVTRGGCEGRCAGGRAVQGGCVGGRAGGRVRGRAGCADARVAGQSADARAGGPLPGGWAGGQAGRRAGSAMQLLRRACKKAGAQVYRI